MRKNELSNPRVNLIIPLDVSIHIDKEADKKNITKAQYIREAINDKLIRVNSTTLEQSINNIQEEIKELRILNLAILDKLNKYK